MREKEEHSGGTIREISSDRKQGRKKKAINCSWKTGNRPRDLRGNERRGRGDVSKGHLSREGMAKKGKD